MPAKRASLAARRKVVGFSQEGLAERLQVDRSTVVRWENGESEPQPWKRAELAKSLRVSVEQLDELLTGQTPVTSRPGSEGGAIRLPDGKRLCGECGLPLSRYNSGNICQACLNAGQKDGSVRRVNVGAFRDSVNISPEFWDEQETAEPKSIRSENQELSTVLDVTSDFSASDDTDEVEYEPDIIEAVKRRVFLAELAASASLGIAGLPLEAVRHGLNLSLAEERSAADADEWNAIALEYGESYLTTAPSDLLKPLMVDMIGLQNALQRNSAVRSQRDLLRVAALLSVFTAQSLMNTGQVHEARRWWRTAKNCADRSGDPYSILWVRAREINRAPEFRPAAAVLLLVDEAENHLDHAPVDAVLEFFGAKALTLARVGRLHDAESSLDQLRKRSDGVTGESGSLLVFDRAGALHGIESFVYSRLGNLEKTESAYESATELRNSGNMRHQADDGMKVGFCLVRKGDVTEGLHHAQTVLAQLPTQHRAQYLVGEAHELMRSIPANGRQLNAAHEYREWLSSL